MNPSVMARRVGRQPAVAHAMRAPPLICLLLTGAMLPALALAQQAPATTAQQAAKADAALADEVMSSRDKKQIEMLKSGDLFSEAKRAMPDPNAGKRPGDEKLNCEQIKAEFDVTQKKADAQEARRDAALGAAEAHAVQAWGPSAGQTAKGLLTGLAGTIAAATGTTDVLVAKTLADEKAKRQRYADLQSQVSQEDEAIKATLDRGERLMGLGKAKGCKALVPAP